MGFKAVHMSIRSPFARQLNLEARIRAEVAKQLKESLPVQVREALAEEVEKEAKTNSTKKKN